MLNWLKSGRVRRFAACLLPLLMVGCAKTGAPHPPVVLVPKPAIDLSAMQYSDQVLLSASLPSENTDGSAIAKPGVIQVLRRIEKIRPAPGILPEKDFLDGATLILAIPPDKISDYQKDKKLVVRDELSLPDRASIYSLSFRYAVRYLNHKKQSAGLSNQTVIAPVEVPSPAKGLAAEVSQEHIRLKWTAPDSNVDGSRPPRIAGYNVYRTEDPKSFPPAPLNAEPLKTASFEDGSFQFDKTYYYTVSVVASIANPAAESFPAPSIQVEARDTFAPGVPLNLNGVATEGAVLLLWAAPPDPDIAGYKVYRKEEGAASYQILQTDLISTLSWRDDKAPAGKRLLYRVTAVDNHGNEGQPAETVVEPIR
jgi:hypothetical protein